MRTHEQAVTGLPVAFAQAVIFLPQFCERSKNVHVRGVMVDCDEFCFRLGENGGRVKVDCVLMDVCSQRLPPQFACMFVMDRDAVTWNMMIWVLRVSKCLWITEVVDVPAVDGCSYFLQRDIYVWYGRGRK